MTREEAVKLLTQYIDYDAETPDYYEMEKACKVAIKALEQEPCEDAISKQAVLEMAYDMSAIDGEHFTERYLVVDAVDGKFRNIMMERIKNGVK